MALLTIAMVLAMQDARARVHEDPAPRTGPVRPRRIATPATSSVNEPRRRRPASPVPDRRRADLPVNGPPVEDRPLGKPKVAETPVNGPPSSVVRTPPPRPRPPAPPPPAPPMPPPPAALPAGATAPVPRSSPQSWVTGDDYPMPALRAHATGVVAFELDIEADGTISACRVTGSSGSSLLDTMTCAMMRRRGRFTPARNSAGVAIRARWQSQVRWELPDTPVALGSWARVTRFVVDAEGRITSCTVTHHGAVPAIADPCAGADPWRLKLLHGPGAGLVTINHVEIHRVEGMALPLAFSMPAGRQVFERTIRFGIDGEGGITRCSVARDTGQAMLPSAYAAYTCHTGLRYRMGGRRGAANASFSFEIVTNGEAPRFSQPAAVTRAPPSAIMPPGPRP